MLEPNLRGYATENGRKHIVYTKEPECCTHTIKSFFPCCPSVCTEVSEESL